MKNILPSKKAKGGKDKDLFISLDLKSSFNQLDELDMVKILDAEDQFNKEREESFKYRLSGNLDYNSFFSNKKIIWNSLDDLFLTSKIDTPNIHHFNDFFDIYIVYPSVLEYIRKDNLYVKKYKKLSKVTDINLLKSGFQSNVFLGEVFNYNFNILKDLKDVEGTRIINLEDPSVNNILLPITELGLYFEYKNINDNTNLKYKNFNSNDYSLNNYNLSDKTVYGFNDKDVDINNLTYEYLEKIVLYKSLNISMLDTNNTTYLNSYLNKNPLNFIKINGVIDEIPGELVEFDKLNFNFITVEKQEFFYDYIINRPNDGYDKYTIDRLTKILNPNIIDIDIKLNFKYEPIYKIIIKDYLPDVEYGNPLNTDNIPSYAIKYNDNDNVKSYLANPNTNLTNIDEYLPNVNSNNPVTYENADFLWKDLLTNGTIEPDTLEGSDFIFMNGHHYVNNIHRFEVKPNLQNKFTRRILNDFLPSNKILSFNKPKDDNSNNC